MIIMVAPRLPLGKKLQLIPYVHLLYLRRLSREAIIDAVAPHLAQSWLGAPLGEQLNNLKLLAKYGLAAGVKLPGLVSPKPLTPRWSSLPH